MITRWCLVVLLVCVSLHWGQPAYALDSNDLLFHLSFDQGVTPEFARGSAAPTTAPDDVQRRLVEGLIGNGYLFAGKGSTLEFYTGSQAGGPQCAEMYSSTANFYGNSGTVAFWVKVLADGHDMLHLPFTCNGPGTFQTMHDRCVWHTHFAGSEVGYTDGGYLNEWLHLAVTFQQGRVQAFFNGRSGGHTIGERVLDPTPARFQVARETLLNTGIRQKEPEDDMILDEFQVFRRPLAAEEILALFERGHTTVHPPINSIGYGPTVHPERGYLPATLAAPRIAAPITPDGDLREWTAIPAHGAFTERRVGVLDQDDALVSLAVDDRHLYLAFRTVVDDELHNDPTHVKYPSGQYLANARQRDDHVDADDYIAFDLRGANGHHYRFALSAKGALQDSRDGDAGWNAHAAWASRSDFTDWTAELAIPLADMGMVAGETVEFNAVRSWKLFKSSQNTLFITPQSQPGFGKLTLGSPVTAAVSSLGRPDQGHLAISGAVAGAPGDYTVKIHGKGVDNDYRLERSVTVTAQPTPFSISKRLESTGDAGVMIEVVDPDGKVVYARSVPYVMAKTTGMELANYPGWGKLDVTLNPLGSHLQTMSGQVVLQHKGKEVQTQHIASFEQPVQTVCFVTEELPEGHYEVVATLMQDGRIVDTVRQAYEKKPLPDWYRSKAGIIDAPPVPWTDVQVNGSTVSCLLKEITFDKSLFPTGIVSNGQRLLAEPIRLRITRNGVTGVVTASDFRITERTRRQMAWTAVAHEGDLHIRVNGTIAFDGFTWLTLTFFGGSVEHAAVEIPLRRESATLNTLNGKSLTGNTPFTGPYTNGSYWFGNEKAGFQYWWQSNKGWVLNNQPVTVTPTETQVLISIPFIQKSYAFEKPRSIEFGWAVTPSKPVRKDWRHICLHRGVGYSYGDFANITPNYPKAYEKKETYDLWRFRWEHEREKWPITCYYMYGPFMCPGTPEYADWWQEWRVSTMSLKKPDPNSTGWGGPACHNSSATELQCHLLEQYAREYPLQGLYYDCMGGNTCGNEAHGCGYIDDQGTRRPEYQLLAERRYYERIYNIIKAANPLDGWVRHHDWSPSMPIAAFCDDNWLGEGDCGALAASKGKNYFDIYDLPTFRMKFVNEQWGHLTSWLTEMATAGPNTREWREAVYGKMISPPKDGKRGEWILPKWKDYEHVAGLVWAHDAFITGGNSLDLPVMVLREMQRQAGFDDTMQFIGYWALGNALRIEGGEPEKIVCSLYFKPAGKDAQGAPTTPWLMLAPFNNTDYDVTLTLRPNLAKFGLDGLENGRCLDLYRAINWTFAPTAWKPNNDDPEPPYMVGKPVHEYFPLRNGAVSVTVPARSFRALLVLGADEQPGLNPPSNHLPL
jgi:hypothetical protein